MVFDWLNTFHQNIAKDPDYPGGRGSSSAGLLRSGSRTTAQQDLSSRPGSHAATAYLFSWPSL